MIHVRKLCSERGSAREKNCSDPILDPGVIRVRALTLVPGGLFLPFLEGGVTLPLPPTLTPSCPALAKLGGMTDKSVESRRSRHIEILGTACLDGVAGGAIARQQHPTWGAARRPWAWKRCLKQGPDMKG